MTDWLKPLLLMFYSPARAMAEVRQRAPLGPAVLLTWAAQCVTLLYVEWPYLFAPETHVWRGSRPLFSLVWTSAMSVLFIAIPFVLVVIFVTNVIERRGSFSLTVQQEYATVASSIFYARAVASVIALPAAILARVSGFEAEVIRQSILMAEEVQKQLPPDAPPLALISPIQRAESFAFSLILIFFIPWLVVAVREAFSFTWARAAIATFISCALMVPISLALLPLFSRLLASPFILLVFVMLMRGYFTEVMRGQRARASFKQNIEASTLNPADASAHYNLGLIHLQRRELDAARARFERATEIDADEVDSHFQLGRIARSQARLADAIKHFEQVVTRDRTHAQHEIWREIGATYVHAGQFEDARDALERYLDERQSDPEGLYLMGRAHAGMGQRREAADWMRACIEAVKTAPAYKYRTEKRWLNEAQQFLRSLA